jgi:hypothetical protein
MNAYLGKYSWMSKHGFSCWKPPKNCIGAIDLRSIPQQAAVGGEPRGYGIFVYPSEVKHPLLEIHLGDDPNGKIPLTARHKISECIGRVSSRRFDGLLKEFLLEKTDPSGVYRCKPVIGSIANGLKLTLGGFGQIFSEKFSEYHDDFQRSIDVFKHDYSRHNSAKVKMAGCGND